MSLVIVLLGCLAGLMAFILLLTVIPVRYGLGGSWQDAVMLEAKAQYGPFLIKFGYESSEGRFLRLSFWGLKIGGKGEKKKEPSPAEAKSPQNKKKAKSALTVSDLRFIGSKDFLAALLRMITAVYRHSRPACWKISGVLGFEDPYYTGLFAAAMQLVPGADIVPEFSEEVIALKIDIRGRIIALALLSHLLFFLMSRGARPLLLLPWRIVKRKREIKITKEASINESC